MKSGKFSIIAVVFVVFFASLSLALDSPIGSGREPVTSTQSGLVRSPNPIDRSTDLVVTGNVGGGKHFRGIVPYNAVTDFGAPTSTSTFDPFLRRSSDAGGYRFTDSGYTPFYSQTSTVTKAMPGYTGVFRAPTAAFSYSPQTPQDFAAQEISPDSAQPLLYFKYRPMALTPQELEKTISSEVEKYSQKQQEEFVEQHRQMELEKFREQLRQISKEAEDLKRSLVADDDVLKQPIEPELAEQASQIEQEFEDSEEEKGLDVYEQMKQIIEEIQKSEEETPQKEQPDQETPSEQQMEEVQPSDKLAEISLSVVKARIIVGEFKTFASFVDDKFNRYLRAGENYLKEGKYYSAADAYTMASVYRPQDPLAYAGRSHALFAAGEYMSSALFLSRALELFPEYAAFKIDLVSMVGDRDILETRIAEVNQWLEKSRAAELQFLLGYIYLQMDMLEDAQVAIEAAYEKMPDSPSVNILKTVINAAVELNKTSK